MKITFLGTGASHGIPVIGCGCNVCKSANAKDKRLRSSIFIETDRTNIIIDVGPDFRQQMLREKITKIDAVLITHEHKDHTSGMDDLRAYNYLMKRAMNIYARNDVLETIRREYEYVFKEDKYPGSPEFDLFPIDRKPFVVNSTEVVPVKAFHHLLPVLGYRIGNVAYLTDVKIIPEEEKEKLQNLDVLIISSLRVKEHIAHMGLDEVLTTIEELAPKKTYLTHISHMHNPYDEFIKDLPVNVMPAYDGLSILVE